MPKTDKWDFSGWATKNDLKCSDGRVIRRDAFAEQDGEVVPLVWNHRSDDAFNVLGHALLKNDKDGVRTYIKFNENTEQGRNAKALVEGGDVTNLSIFANNLVQRGSDVLHGAIKEVSLVTAGANPGAVIDDVSFAHGADEPYEADIYTNETIEAVEDHEDSKPEEDVLEHSDNSEEELQHADSKEGEDMAANKDPEEIFNSMNDEQKELVYAMVGQAIEDTENANKEESEEMKHNVFEGESQDNTNYLSHADMENILKDAQRCGSLREAVEAASEGGTLMHSIDTTGMTVSTGNQTYGFNDPEMLFPDYKSLNNPPEWISRNMDWVSDVMAGVTHTPFSRIKSQYANITEDEARAKGYIKGKRKKDEVFTILKRTTDPQTIYKKQKMDRDDIIDITDFDVVAWIRAEMRVMLNEEIARAILIGDGRLTSSDDHISESHIRPIVNDDPLFNTKVNVNVSANATSEEKAKETINAVIRARKNYKGSGNPVFYTTEDTLTEMLLIEDGIGHKLYKTETELATALRVRKIVTVEPMEGVMIDSKPLVGVIVNLRDYNVGADKGGQINMFDDFDIDYNQYAYLIETRISGALVKPFSALTILMNQAGANSGTTPAGNGGGTDPSGD